jgi:hypothetical protein
MTPAGHGIAFDLIERRAVLAAVKTKPLAAVASGQS